MEHLARLWSYPMLALPQPYLAGSDSDASDEGLAVFDAETADKGVPGPDMAASTWGQLPRHMLLHIAGFLAPADRTSIRAASRFFRRCLPRVDRLIAWCVSVGGGETAVLTTPCRLSGPLDSVTCAAVFPRLTPVTIRTELMRQSDERTLVNSPFDGVLTRLSASSAADGGGWRVVASDLTAGPEQSDTDSTRCSLTSLDLAIPTVAASARAGDRLRFVIVCERDDTDDFDVFMSSHVVHSFNVRVQSRWSGGAMDGQLVIPEPRLRSCLCPRATSLAQRESSPLQRLVLLASIPPALRIADMFAALSDSVAAPEMRMRMPYYARAVLQTGAAFARHVHVVQGGDGDAGSVDSHGHREQHPRRRSAKRMGEGRRALARRNKQVQARAHLRANKRRQNWGCHRRR